MAEHQDKKPQDAEESVHVTSLASSDAKNDVDEASNVVLIGGNCQVKGEIRNCRRLEIEGMLEGDLETEEIIVRDGGRIAGQIKTRTAEIHGNVDGQLFVEDLLDIHETGIVDGDVNYGKLSIATGGQVIGNLRRAPLVAAALPDQKKRPAVIDPDENAPQASISKIIDGLMQAKD